MNTVTERLKKARKKIEHKDAWTKGACARDSNGNAVLVDSPCATQWCLLGASLCATRDASTEENRALFRVLDQAMAESTEFFTLAIFNDVEQTTHKKVLKFFDNAIRIAEETQHGIS